MEKSIDVKIMQIVKEFDYLIKKGEYITISELKHRAESVPGIMDEPELQFISQAALSSTISNIKRNSMGYWYDFKSFDPMRLFTIIGNDDLKRFEFNSSSNMLPSYTVSYHEADNIIDAKITIYKALKLEAERQNKKLEAFFQELADTGIC